MGIECFEGVVSFFYRIAGVERVLDWSSLSFAVNAKKAGTIYRALSGEDTIGEQWTSVEAVITARPSRPLFSHSTLSK